MGAGGGFGQTADGREMTMAMGMVSVVGIVCKDSSVGGVRKIEDAQFLRKTKNCQETP